MPALTVRDARLDGAEITLRCAGGVIAAIGAAVEPAPGDEVIDATGKALLPGLVNAHTHAAMTLFRGTGGDLPLMRWLEERIWPVEANLGPEDVYWGTRLACLEMIRSGTVCFWDMYWHAGESARAARDAGLRAMIMPALFDLGQADRIAALPGEAADHLDAFADPGDEAVRPALAAHSIYTVSEQSLRALAEIVAERDVFFQIHLSETPGEVAACLSERGLRPTQYLDAVGLLGPRTLLAHGVHLDEAELDLIADRGATIVTNPVANMKLAVGGTFPYPAAKRRGIGVAIGTDGAGSNDSLDLLSDLKVFALAQKLAADDAAAITAEEALAVGAGVATRQDVLERSGLVEGAPADFLLVDLAHEALSPGPLTSNLVYSATGAVVDTTVVAGRVLMRERAVEGADEVRARAAEAATRLGLE